MTDVIGLSPQVQLGLYRWTNKYFDLLLQPIRQVRSSTATERSGATHRDPAFSRNLLAGDGPACPITGTIHLKASRKDISEWVDNFSQPDDGVHEDILESCHINPFSIADKPTTRQHLAMFSGNTILETEIAGSRINGLENGLMMEAAAHNAFASYRFGIECIDDVSGSLTSQYSVFCRQ